MAITDVQIVQLIPDNIFETNTIFLKTYLLFLDDTDPFIDIRASNTEILNDLKYFYHIWIHNGKYLFIVWIDFDFLDWPIFVEFNWAVVLISNQFASSFHIDDNDLLFRDPTAYHQVRTVNRNFHEENLEFAEIGNFKIFTDDFLRDRTGWAGFFLIEIMNWFDINNRIIAKISQSNNTSFMIGCHTLIWPASWVLLDFCGLSLKILSIENIIRDETDGAFEDKLKLLIRKQKCATRLIKLLLYAHDPCKLYFK